MSRPVGVVCPGQTAITADEHHQDVADGIAHRQERMHGLFRRLQREVPQEFPGIIGIGPALPDAGFGLAHPAGTDRLQGTRDLGDVLNAPDPEPHFAGR